MSAIELSWTAKKLNKILVDWWDTKELGFWAKKKKKSGNRENSEIGKQTFHSNSSSCNILLHIKMRIQYVMLTFLCTSGSSPDFCFLFWPFSNSLGLPPGEKDRSIYP